MAKTAGSGIGLVGRAKKSGRPFHSMSVDVLIVSWAAWGGGRARALLSLSDRLSDSHTVSVVTGVHAHSPETLQNHHGFFPDCTWETVDWKDDRSGHVRDAVDRHDPDVIISFDGLLHGCLKQFDRPTVTYCRTGVHYYSDEVWCPSRTVRDRFNDELQRRGQEPVCRAVYPIWYIEPERADCNRPIDVMVHGRKSRGQVSQLVGSYNVLLANVFTYRQLKEYYKQTKLFLFPKPDRFEPLGLMPIEAAAYGCNLLLPKNCGAAEIYPGAVHGNPTDCIECGLKQEQDFSLPNSPIDPVERIEEIGND